ncbi:MAG: 16S rRNA (cytosine(1402)-N(4))-methyltransferase RsmH [Treponema sp.]|nr:16S rRNA (cytosine(1402)-N(4))-methyltransferase RsmH [Treponema sp.]
MQILHKPVLLQECLHYLNPEDGICGGNEFMIDSTLGEGGHSEAFLTKYTSLNIMGLDADASIQSQAKQRLAGFGSRMSFFNGWFNDFYRNYPDGLPHPDIILFDLGISVYHYEKSGRGFSFRYDEPLDMRLNSLESKSAADIVNTMDEESLADLIYRYGEERYSRRIAKAVVTARCGERIVSSKALADIIYDAVPSKYRHGQIHPATRTFQALRIAVNSELQRLPQALQDAFSVLNNNGKMGVITFHSLEDRIVKNYFRNLGKRCVCPPEYPKCVCGGEPCAEILTRKPVLPSEEEIQHNSPSRSAKLRVVRKLKDASVRDHLHIAGKGL